jgi:peptidyl-prolyl cis-trans isomerase A (cyclophilin A)
MKAYKASLVGVVLALVTASNTVWAQKYVCMQSNQGEWCMQLFPESAPKTVVNFLRYVTNNLYTNSMVHRSVPNFVIQGGGYEIDEQGFMDLVPSYEFVDNEFKRSNKRGTVAMARYAGLSNSATNQWFINLSDANTFLDTVDGGFTVFAEVVYGMDVVDKIATLRVGDLSSITTEFSEIPVDLPANSNIVERQNLVIINKAYATYLLPGQVAQPFHCTVAVPNDAMTELCGVNLSFPVQLTDGSQYEVILERVANQMGLVFAVKTDSIKALPTKVAIYATFDAVTGELKMPSVRVDATIFDQVTLTRTSSTALEFAVKGFTVRL